MKRLLAFAIAVMMVFAMVPVSVSAAEDVASVTVNGTTTGYTSLADAVAASNAATSDYTVTLLKDCEEDILIIQKAGVNTTFTAKAGVKYSGYIEIDGGNPVNNRSGNETLTFKDIAFDRTNSTKTGYFISSNDVDNSVEGRADNRLDYAHNVTFTGCSFVDDSTSSYGIQMRQDANITVTNCTVDGLGLFIWAIGNTNESNKATVWTISDVTITNVTEGISLETSSCIAEISNVTIEAEGYGIRYTPGTIMVEGATISNSSIVAAQPVVIRAASETYDVGKHPIITLAITGSELLYTDEANAKGVAVINSNKAVIGDHTWPYAAITLEDTDIALYDPNAAEDEEEEEEIIEEDESFFNMFMFLMVGFAEVSVADEDGNAVVDADFDLYTKRGKLKKSFTTDENGCFRTRALMAGEYFIVPAGEALDKENAFTFKIEKFSRTTYVDMIVPVIEEEIEDAE